MQHSLRLCVLLLLTLCIGGASADSITTTTAAEAAGPRFVKLPKTYRYRVTFTDKDNNPYSLKRPQEFLSPRALERRKKFKIKVDHYDLPVTPVYLQYLSDRGLRVLNVSKWNNTAVVETSDTALVASLKSVKFVSNVKRVWVSPDSVEVGEIVDRRQMVINSVDSLANPYGHAEGQVKMIGVDKLHAAGFTGKGVVIAVIDGGFMNADCIAGFDSTLVLGTRNFVSHDESVYDGQPHGTMVLSCMAARSRYGLVGTSPDAAYYLLMSEDGATEHMVEEDNWCAAIEYADSVGADVATSSLGYMTFDDTLCNHKYYELDGATAVNSRSASLAASRGLLVLNSAGNSGDEEWKKIGFPADAKDILTVGAVTDERKNAVFSSVGNTADGRIKPDVMALGQTTWLYDITGSISVANGTSFSTPLMAGGVACLLQAFPDKRPEEIIRAVQQAGDNAAHPDNIYGYGIPDLMKAHDILKND